MSRLFVFAVAVALLGTTSDPAAARERDEMMAVAVDYANHTWTATSANLTASCAADYSSVYGAGTHQGVAYDWGGFSSLSDYDAKLAQGYGAGSEPWDGVLSCTVGVDCSGFISRCWGLSYKRGTWTLPEIAHPINAADIRRGDIWNDAGHHVVLWSEYASDGAPIFYESSLYPNKARHTTTATWAYLAGYKALRFDDVAGDPPATDGLGAPDQPIQITHFPFYDTRDSRSSGSDALDAYSCAPSTSEAGAEVVYVFDLPHPGTLTASLTDGVGVDVDIHLLTAIDPAACIARDHLTVGPTHLDAGHYVLIVDSWTDASGHAFEGVYELSVTFQADPGVEPTPTGDAVGSPCTSSASCTGATAVCLSMPGGYCSIGSCESTSPCPSGTACFLFQGEDSLSLCLETCEQDSDCRNDEGYICDADKTCWPDPEAPDEPTDPVDEPTDPVDEPTDPVDEPTDPIDEPTDPVDEPTDPVDEPTDPIDEPTDPAPTSPGPTVDPARSAALGERTSDAGCAGSPPAGGLGLMLAMFGLALIAIRRRALGR